MLLYNQLLCVLVLLVARLVNALVPFVLGGIVHVFEEGSSTSPWPYLFLYVALRFLQGSGGLAALIDVRAVYPFWCSLF